MQPFFLDPPAALGMLVEASTVGESGGGGNIDSQSGTSIHLIDRPAVLTTLAAASILVACGGGSSTDSNGDGGTSSGTGANSDGGTSSGIGANNGETTGSSTGTSSGGGSTDPSPAPASLSDVQAARFLLQAQLSTSTADIASVRNLGTTAWLTAQYATPLGPTGWDWLNSRGYSAINDSTRFYGASFPADYMVWNQLMTAPDSTCKRMALALSEFFVVSLEGLNVVWSSYLAAGYWDMLSARAFGNFRSLLEAVTLHPAMGVYLNTLGNLKEDASIGRLPDENYAREVMQLMTIGLFKLNQDGSYQLDAYGQRIDTFGQTDVSNLARVFTGYDNDQSQNVITVEPVSGMSIGSIAFARKPMLLRANRHSTLSASFLGVTIGAGTDGASALKTALDTLFNHPNVGPFFGRQMIQLLVTSNPSPGYVARVAAAFNNNGAGVRGDLKAVWSAVLQDTEACSERGLTDPTFGKLREPMLRLVQWGRTFGVTSARGSWKIGDQSNPATNLGQSPLRAPSVFNFFRPGYVPPGTVLVASAAMAPEFQIVNESTVGGYLNMMQIVVLNGLYVQAPDQPSATNNPATDGYDITASYTSELALAADASALVSRLNLLLCAGQLSAATQTLVLNALNATPLTAASTTRAKRNRVAAAVLLVMASSEYLVQK